MQNVDTHRMIEEFIEAGIPKNQAEVIVDKFLLITEDKRSELVTKNDLKIGLLELRTELKTDIEKMSNKILMWMISLFVAVFLGIISLKITF